MSPSPRTAILHSLFLVPSSLFILLPACATTPPRPTTRLPPGGRVAAVLPLVRAAAARHGVPVELVLGVIKVESSFRPEAGSHAGARGLMQLMPRTAASLARQLNWGDYEISDPAFNIEAGTFYLAYLIKRYDSDLFAALAAYNSGPGRVSGWRKRGLPPPAYSRRYVANVLAARAQFTAGDAQPEPLPAEGMDRRGLKSLIKNQQQLYGHRPDVPVVPQQAQGDVGGSR